MSVKLSPFYFLVNSGVALGLSYLFVSYKAHQRLRSPKKTVFLEGVDVVCVGLGVLITSLFSVWTAGGLLVSYFGSYSVFKDEQLEFVTNLKKLEIIFGVLQRTSGFLVLALCGFQGCTTGNPSLLRAWSLTCCTAGSFLGVLLLCLRGSVTGLLGELFICALSVVLDMVLIVFSGCAMLILRRDVPRFGVSSYVPQKILGWNTGVCATVAFSGTCSMLARILLIWMELKSGDPLQLLVDLASVLKCLGTFQMVLTIYQARIPYAMGYQSNE